MRLHCMNVQTPETNSAMDIRKPFTVASSILSPPAISKGGVIMPTKTAKRCWTAAKNAAGAGGRSSIPYTRPLRLARIFPISFSNSSDSSSVIRPSAITSSIKRFSRAHSSLADTSGDTIMRISAASARSILPSSPTNSLSRDTSFAYCSVSLSVIIIPRTLAVLRYAPVS